MKNYGLLMALWSIPALAHYDLRPVSPANEDIEEKDVARVQKEFDEALTPLIEQWNKTDDQRTTVFEPIIDDIRTVSVGHRLLMGPFAKGARVTLRVKVTLPDGSQESRTFSYDSGAWHGTVTAGSSDHGMIGHVVKDAIDYLTEVHDRATGEHVSQSDTSPVAQ